MTVVRRCRPLLGTFVAVEAEESGRSARALHALVDAALGAVARVQALLSFHDPASELARLNRAAHVAPVAVDPWTREVLAEALRIARASGGAFDPSVGPALVRLGFLPRPVGAARAAARGSWRDVELLADGRVRFASPLQLDLGGIAKGYAADRAAAVLAAAGVGRACVDAGGDLRFAGAAPRCVHVRDPRAPWNRRIALPMTGNAVATSGTYASRRLRRGRWVSPLIDPRSGRSLGRSFSVSVFAPDALRADALTKVAVFAGVAGAERLLRAEGACAVVLSAEGSRTELAVAGPRGAPPRLRR